MSKPKRSKGISYFFRIEFSSLQGKITTGFCALGLICILLIGISAYLLIPALQKSVDINETTYPSHLQLLELQYNVDHSIAKARETHLYLHQSLTPQLLEQQELTIQKRLDSLAILARNWQSNEEKLSLQMAAAKTAAVLQKISTANNSSDLSLREEIYHNDLPILQQELHKVLSTITKKQLDLREDNLNFAHSRLSNYIWVLLLCFLGAFITGSVIGSFIVVKVLAVIKLLKYKILELSEGKLIPPVPPSKDELNSIGKAINILTDNLRDIREFAREVGQGNFDTNISVFNNQNDLGQSLATMRESLRKVAEEEKIRSWTANGLANFNEFLRNSENEAEKFEKELCSKIVKYLEVNQGALYISSRQDSGRDQLVLKACYAYDRQKFLEKTIEAGQGLVGQAYLEKEYIHLSGIPDHFTTISSGLGEATPRHLLVMPLKVNQEVKGVLELASFSVFPAYKISFLEKLAESIASAIANVESSHITHRLLQEAREMADTMKAQEESLRQNSEELQATQEQLERELNSLQNELSLAEGALALTENPLLTITESKILIWMNSAAEKMLGHSLSRHRNQPLRTIFSVEELQIIEKALKATDLQNGLTDIVLQQERFHFQLKANTFKVNQEKYFGISFAPLRKMEPSL